MGLEYANGDEAFYSTLLQMFLDAEDEKKTSLSKALEEGDTKAYVVSVHALKSNSKMIGAMELSKKALEMEDMGKEEDIGYIREHHESLMKYYDDTLEEIRGMLG